MFKKCHQIFKSKRKIIKIRIVDFILFKFKKHDDIFEVIFENRKFLI